MSRPPTQLESWNSWFKVNFLKENQQIFAVSYSFLCYMWYISGSNLASTKNCVREGWFNKRFKFWVMEGRDQIGSNDLQRARFSCGSMIRLQAHPLPPPVSRQQVASLSQSSCLSPVELGGKRVGVEPNHATTRKPKSFNTLWSWRCCVSSGSLHGDPRHSHRGGVLTLEQEEDTHRDPRGRELEAQAGEALKNTVLYKTGRKKDP